MNIFIKAILSALVMLTCSLASATSINIEQGYVREVIPGNEITSAYMTVINNSNQDVQLVGVSSSVSPRVEIHEHLMADGMMKMRQVPYIDIAAGEQVVFQPMGLHLMLFDLNQPVKAGQKITITLLFANGDKKSLLLPVRSIIKAKKHHH